MSSVSRGVVGKLKEYQQLLIKWNRTINLISKNTETDVWERHILDSLQLLNYVNLDDNICDIGSGGGLPGIVLSIAGVKNVTLVESDKRKASFLLQASKVSSNKVTIVIDRIENVDRMFDVVTSRAFAELDIILSVAKAKRYLLLKGKNYQNEIDRAKLTAGFDCKIYGSSTSEEGVVLDITNVKKLNVNKNNINS